jgi:hypothetical protein
MRREMLYKTIAKLFSVDSYGKKLNEYYSKHQKCPTFKASKYLMHAWYLYALFNYQVGVL